MQLPRFVGVAALAVSAGALAQPTTTEPPKVVAAVKDCAQATTSEGVEQELLASSGWQEVEVEMTDNPLPEQPTVFGKDRTHPLIRIVFNEQGNSGCLVEGWLADKPATGSLDSVLIEHFGEARPHEGMRAHYFENSVAMVLPEPMLSNFDFRIIVTKAGEAE